MAIYATIGDPPSRATLKLYSHWEGVKGYIVVNSTADCYVAAIQSPDGTYLYNKLGTIQNSKELTTRVALNVTFTKGTYTFSTGVLDSENNSLAEGGVISNAVVGGEEQDPQLTVVAFAERIADIKKDILEAIASKGVDITSKTAFAKYPSLIRAITTSSGTDSDSSTSGSSTAPTPPVVPDIPFTTATPDVIVQGYTAYVNGEVITGTMPLSKPSLTTKGIRVPRGYVQEEIVYSVSNTQSVIVPGREDIHISGGVVISDIYIRGDENLLAENIKDGVTIFGVSGNYVGAEAVTISRNRRVDIALTEL